MNDTHAVAAFVRASHTSGSGAAENSPASLVSRGNVPRRVAVWVTLGASPRKKRPENTPTVTPLPPPQNHCRCHTLTHCFVGDLTSFSIAGFRICACPLELCRVNSCACPPTCARTSSACLRALRCAPCAVAIPGTGLPHYLILVALEFATHG